MDGETSLLGTTTDIGADEWVDSDGDQRKQFWGRHLWGRGYLAVSAGTITEKLSADYIAEQEGEPVHDDSRFLIDEEPPKGRKPNLPQ